MPANKNKQVRIERLNEYFRLGHFTLDEIVRKISKSLWPETISKRQIQDDIKYMRESGAPITSRKDGRRTEFQYEYSNYSFFNKELTAEEREQLETAIGIISALKTFHISSDLQDIFYNLTRLRIENENHSAFIQFETYQTKGYEYLDEIYAAIKNKTVLQLSYQTFISDTPKTFILHCHLLKEYRKRWYVVATVDGKDKIATFALDRIQGKLKPLNKHYKPCPNFDPQTYYQHVIGVNRKQNDLPQKIVLKVAKEQVPYFLSQPFHDTQEVISINEDGTALMQYHLIDNYELKQMLNYYSGSVEVVEPLILRTD